MNHAGIRSALSRIAWAYLLIHLHFRLNNLDVLPDWAGYLLIFSAIGLLAGELRDLPLLRPFCILLGAVSGVDWLSFLLTGAEFTGRFFLLSALITVWPSIPLPTAHRSGRPGRPAVRGGGRSPWAAACGCAATRTRCSGWPSACSPIWRTGGGWSC